MEVAAIISLQGNIGDVADPKFIGVSWYHSFCKEFVLAKTMVAIGRGLPVTSLTEAVSHTVLNSLWGDERSPGLLAPMPVSMSALAYTVALRSEFAIEFLPFFINISSS